MTLNPEADPRLADFPPLLRKLIDAEIAAGNTIVEVASCFPAPPAGAYVKLARMITTRPRQRTAELDFYERNSSIYSGEWTDARRFYWVIEPPLPPPPEPDMDAIRAARNSDQSLPRESGSRAVARRDTDASPIVQRFRDSMVIDYEKWHDGIGYDLEAIMQATGAERKTIEDILVARGVEDWRDVEALAALDTERARQLLRRTLTRGKLELRGAVIRYAPNLVSVEERNGHLIQALRTATFYHGLSQALDEVARSHPPEIVRELLRGALKRDGEVAVHFAAMLVFIHGQAKSSFDWEQRPFFLRFHAPVGAEREAVFRELCARIGVNSAAYL